MEKKRQIFEETLTQSFDSDKYLIFLREMLPDIEIIAPNKEMQPYNTFSAAIENYRHIANYTGEDKNKVAVFSVCLKNDKNLENARSMQRAFVKTLLESSNCDGALVAFHTKGDSDKWRLSLVRMDYEFSKGKISENLTPAKRYSYLVGKGEPCHTAQERMYQLFVSDNVAPSLDALEEAFSVEAVTKEFFDKYREKYLDLKEFLDGNEQFLAESKARGFDSEQFAKKLMGQIVFLYFIQKKGWLGVNAFPAKLTAREYKDSYFRRGPKAKELLPKVYKQKSDGLFYRDGQALLALSAEDETCLSTLVKGDAWGNGPKDFMRQIFEGCKKSGKNFFDDYLEPLFYTGLNQNRGDNAFFQPLHRRVPFLNGGLFEELDGYDWRNNDFCIPNELFSNVEKKGKREADGILDVFDRYNFTMAEDEPMEREVAIDPEMLGKVFENLLDVTDRKSKGAFYTPREIVHYMCQETIINYLSGKTGIPDEDIRKFILYGEYFRDEDAKKTLPVDSNGRVLHGDEKYSVKYHFAFDKNKELEIPATIFSFKENVNRLQEIDDLLTGVKVVDLSVGSGAFPLGMLTEIVKARETITAYMGIGMRKKEKYLLYARRNPYRMKRDAIKNSIFACDIEPSAVDITKLRLWLSLVIDNQIMNEENDELGHTTKPRELPNLDCNIICGNSLMDEFEGVKLITENSELNNISGKEQGTIYDLSLGKMINELIELQEKLYDEKERVEKESLKRQIQDIYDKIVMEQLQANPEIVDDYYKATQMPSKPFVLWQLYFPKVFRDNGGFDIVIGNPPYGAKISDSDKKAYKRIFYATKTIKGVQKGSMDTFVLFIEKGLNILREGKATLSYIVPMSVTSSDAMTALHKIIERKCANVWVSSYSNRPKQIFDAACVRTSIIQLGKTNTPMKHLYTSKLIRRSDKYSISDIIKNLQFVDSCKFKVPGRYAKIGSDEQLNIVRKMFSHGCKLSDYADENGLPIYYRAAGGRYFNVVTPYPTGSSQEKPYTIKREYANVVGAILSTSLFWFYQQAYTDGLHIKQSEIESVPLFNMSNLSNDDLQCIENVYREYLDEIENNAGQLNVSADSSYNVDSVKVYKLSKSKNCIDRLDDCIDIFYGLNSTEINYIKEFEVEFRMGE